MVGISVIGLGYWGPKLLRNLRDHPSVDVRMLYDRDHAAAKRVAVTQETVAASLDDVLGDPGTDAVIIATPPSTHATLVEAALANGKHVLVEKPLCRTLAEAEALVEASDRSGRVLMVGHTYLFNPAILHLRDAILSGKIGQLQYIDAVRTNLGPIRTDVGAAFDLASHDVAISAYLLREFPTRVSATGGSWISKEVHDAVFVSLSFTNNRMANIHASWLHPRKERKVVVVGEAGMAVFDDLDTQQPISYFEKGFMHDVTVGSEGSLMAPPSFRVGDIQSPLIPAHEPLSVEVQAFVAAIEHGVACVSDARFGRNVVAVLEAVNHSIVDGGTSVEVQVVN